MKILKTAILLVLLQVCLTGCWDQRLLKDSRLVYSSAFDLAATNKIESTAIIRDFQGQFPTNVEIQAIGHTLRETRMKMDRKINGSFEPSKNRVFVLGEDLAKKDMYQFLDVFYRDPTSSISAKVAISRGHAGDMLSTLGQKNTLISEYLAEQIQSAEKATETQIQNLQTICTYMFDEGKDFMLPLLALNNNEIVLQGNAIFHKHSMTGELSIPESTLFLAMADKKAKLARFVSKMDTQNSSPLDDYISYSLIKPKSEMKIVSDSPHDIRVEIRMKTGITIVEYPADQLTNKKKVNKINKKIQKDLQKRSEKLIETIQASNSDLFGIGRELIAFHPKTWEQLNWEKDYQEVIIIPKIETEIVGNGIIN
ncbi:Ger(x)C family spore germination protein [Lysinibacillus sphaericus]